MADSSSLLEWLNTHASSPVFSLSDPKLSREICYFLVNLAGKPELAQKIEIGKTSFERTSNFQLAKSLLGILNCPFPFTLAKLVEGDPTEIAKLLQTVSALDQSSIDADASLEELFGALRQDLTRKMDEAIEFREKMDEFARARDFYFDKLRRILEAANRYPPDDVKPVRRCLLVATDDFMPAQKPPQ
jgi:hypothetical protein